MSMSNTVIDTITLIQEVEKRPPIWNKQLKEYRDKHLKSKLWLEVQKGMLTNWSELNAGEKKLVGADIQKKWRNLKDTFIKELALQKQADSGKRPYKKRPYIHFEALSFLAAVQTEKDTSRNISIEQLEDEEEEEDESIIAYKIESKRTRKRKRNVVKEEEEKEEEEDEGEEYLNINDEEDEIVEMQPQQEKYDEDICFSRMLVPMFKKLNDDQKHFAKIKILQVLNRAKYYCSPDPLKQRF